MKDDLLGGVYRSIETHLSYYPSLDKMHKSIRIKPNVLVWFCVEDDELDITQIYYDTDGEKVYYYLYLSGRYISTPVLFDVMRHIYHKIKPL